ncbi:MAG TPA: IclR family transcriptional regulator [Bordetella sp.]
MGDLIRNQGAARAGGEDPPRSGTINSVEHAIELLRCLAVAGGPLGTNDLARRIGLHKSSVSRLAATLEKARLLRRDPATGRFLLGLGLLALAAPLFADFAVADIVEPILVKLAAETGETCSFNIWDGQDAVSIAQVPGSHSVRAFSLPGQRKPAHATATGKILLAHLDEAALSAYCSTPLRRYTDTTITDSKALVENLVQARQRRYAINLGEYESDVGGIAAAVFDMSGRLFGCVATTMPLYRFAPERHAALGAAVSACATEIAEHLGIYRRKGREGPP